MPDHCFVEMGAMSFFQRVLQTSPDVTFSGSLALSSVFMSYFDYESLVLRCQAYNTVPTYYKLMRTIDLIKTQGGGILKRIELKTYLICKLYPSQNH